MLCCCLGIGEAALAAILGAALARLYCRLAKKHKHKHCNEEGCCEDDRA